MHISEIPLFRCGKYTLALTPPRIMAIVNLTADSFSGDGHGGNTQAALRHAEAQLAAGADLLDLGAESTRPGAQPVSAAEQISRLRPVLRALRDCGKPLSVDTTQAEVMAMALAEGADMINDVYALQAPAALETLAASEAGVCLMHMQGTPQTMQDAPHYQDVGQEVQQFLLARVQVCQTAGISADRIMLDPGFGFGKTVAHNVAMLRALPQLAAQGFPVLAGLSRKSMLGALTGRGVHERLAASVAAALLAVAQGAVVLRVHDVAATRDALLVWQALRLDGSIEL